MTDTALSCDWGGREGFHVAVSVRGGAALLAALLYGCGGPPRFAVAGPFSASGSCGAEMGEARSTTELDPANPMDAPEYAGAFAGASVIVTLDDGKLVRVEYDAGGIVGERKLVDTAVVAGRWQEVLVATRWNTPRWDPPPGRLRVLLEGPAPRHASRSWSRGST
ncbi:MAG: hypothetical protein DYH12_17515 [Sorangiineae bacterium PRO1]|nr:hypothetical protein [Sorangiineae bacterium PRO1]